MSDQAGNERATLAMTTVESAEGATCPCGHEALDHDWAGCEECACGRSSIHAVLASGWLAARDRRIRAEALREAADEIGPFQGAVLVGPVGNAFCLGWDAALSAVREYADDEEAR